ncbi:MAG: hypothetical protein VB018_03800 [Lachnospiraceae bacterium]|nr:hypothetical protein [Lachnospiraceae bacterium]
MANKKEMLDLTIKAIREEIKNEHFDSDSLTHLYLGAVNIIEQMTDEELPNKSQICDELAEGAEETYIRSLKIKKYDVSILVSLAVSWREIVERKEKLIKNDC